MTPPKKETMAKKALVDALDPLCASDFDGHTQFSEMSLEMRLLWLSKMARFLWLAKNAKPKTK